MLATEISGRINPKLSLLKVAHAQSVLIEP